MIPNCSFMERSNQLKSYNVKIQIDSRIRDVLFFLIAALFMFSEIPEFLQVPLLGGPLPNDFVIYPLIIGLMYTTYIAYKNNNILISFRGFKKFVLVFWGISFISLICGLLNYPSYEIIAEGPTIKSSVFSYVFLMFNFWGITLSNEQAVMIFITIRELRNILLYSLYTWGGSYMVFCWYHNDVKRALKVFACGCTVSLIVFMIFGVLNILSLAGNIEIKNFMYHELYPYILQSSRVVNNNGEFYYRIDQLRACLPEPSQIGNYAAVIFPLLLTSLYSISNKLVKAFIYVGIGIFVYMCFLTQSRTPLFIVGGIFIIFLILSFFVSMKNIKTIILLLCVITISFGASLNFISQHLQVVGVSNKRVENMGNNIVNNYVKGNVESINLNGDSQRAGNSSRKALIMIHVREGLDYPLLGVGSGLSSGYDLIYVTQDELKNKEIKLFVESIKKEGILESKLNLYAQNEFIQRFSENGILGLIIFLFPFGFILWKLARLFYQKRKQGETAIICMWAFISVLATLISSANGSAIMMYNIWPILGISYATYYQYRKTC